MLGRLLSYVAAASAAVLVAAPALAAGDSYGTKINTACNVSLTAKQGDPVRAVIDVHSNASAPIHGTVTVTVFKTAASTRAARATRAGSAVAARAGTQVWSDSARYTGRRLTLTGPVLPEGRYRAVASFDADPGVYLDCRCFAGVRTASVGGETHTNPGGLPNTGGPSLGWLYLGFGLLGAGGSAVVVGRRRRAA